MKNRSILAFAILAIVPAYLSADEIVVKAAKVYTATGAL